MAKYLAMEKTCSRCKHLFPTESIRSSGYCIECHRAYKKEYYSKNKDKAKLYNEKNKERIKSYLKNYYDTKKTILNDRYASKRKEYYEKNKEHKLLIQRKLRKGNKKYEDYSRDYREKNREKVNTYARNYVKQRRHDDPEFKIRTNLRSRFRAALKVKGLRKHGRTASFLGCTIAELKIYLESKFHPDMTWENHGKVWHIDHVVPCVAFDLSIKEEQQKCFHFSNLQPLFITTRVINGVEYLGNLNKGGRYDLKN